MMNRNPARLSRRDFLRALGFAGGAAALSGLWPHGPVPEALLGVAPTYAQSDGGLSLLRTIDIRAAMWRPLEHNVLKLFRAAVDPIRHRVYVSGILTPHIGIWDATSQDWVGTLDTRLANTKALKYLALDPVAQRLYVRDATHNRLLALDIASDTVLASVDIPQAVGTLVPDTTRGLLYMLTGEAPNFRALDGATLEPVYTTQEMGSGMTQAVHDEAADALYLLEGATRGQGRIYRFDLAQRTAEEVVTFTLPANQRAGALRWDAAGQRFIVGASGRVLVLDAQGNEQAAIAFPRELEYRAMTYDPVGEQIVVLFQRRAPRNDPNAPLNGLGGRLAFYAPDDGRKLGALEFGRNLRSVEVDTASGDLYLPNGDASTLWHIPPDRSEAIPLRLGDSLEQLVPLLGGDLIAMNSRLGGSYLITYDVEADMLETFTAGTWPIPMRANGNGDHLLVLNAWDSTLSVFGFTPERALLNTIPLGLPMGSSDRLPDLAVDSTRGLAYAAYPEFGKIAVVDWSTGSRSPRFRWRAFRAAWKKAAAPGSCKWRCTSRRGRFSRFGCGNGSWTSSRRTRTNVWGAWRCRPSVGQAGAFRTSTCSSWTPNAGGFSWARWKWTRSAASRPVGGWNAAARSSPSIRRRTAIGLLWWRVKTARR